MDDSWDRGSKPREEEHHAHIEDEHVEVAFLNNIELNGSYSFSQVAFHKEFG